MVGPIAMLVLALICAGHPQAEDEAKADCVNAWLKVCESYAMDSQICLARKPGHKPKPLPHPVFRHAQPMRGSQDTGAIWLYRFEPEDHDTVLRGTLFAFCQGTDG